ncbi:hypothetical protein [Desulfuromonas thiophila]|uniref:hypothetical protein n=1 Tax=Desulfuromonas thiophila TaxID=57664 RepID=UPI0029F548B9|nr:hypothetical protein [Desulfuromonas thiophila]
MLTSPDSSLDGQLQLSAAVARLLDPATSTSQRQQAVRGQLALDMREQLLLWFCICRQDDVALCGQAEAALRASTAMALKPLLQDSHLPPELFDFVLRVRADDLGTVILLRSNPVVPVSSWQRLFGHCSYEVLSFFFDSICPFKLRPQELQAVLHNTQATEAMRQQARERLSASGVQPQETGGTAAAGTASAALLEDEAVFTAEEAEDEALAISSKQQLAQELGIGEKIKMAMTGDKEWRTILLRDSNKQVSTAVLQNPRITEGEILLLTQNRSASDELIRPILLNREWLKNYAIRHALVQHPRTPLPQALRFLATLNDKDIRVLAKSRGISSVLVNACRRMLAAKTQR